MSDLIVDSSPNTYGSVIALFITPNPTSRQFVFRLVAMIIPTGYGPRLFGIITRTDPKERVVCNFPKMPIGIFEVTTVSTPKCLLWLLHKGCSGFNRLGPRVNFRNMSLACGVLALASFFIAAVLIFQFV